MDCRIKKQIVSGFGIFKIQIIDDDLFLITFIEAVYLVVFLTRKNQRKIFGAIVKFKKDFFHIILVHYLPLFFLKNFQRLILFMQNKTPMAINRKSTITKNKIISNSFRFFWAALFYALISVHFGCAYYGCFAIMSVYEFAKSLERVKIAPRILDTGNVPATGIPAYCLNG
jgi:hypothetical protein